MRFTLLSHAHFQICHHTRQRLVQHALTKRCRRLEKSCLWTTVSPLEYTNTIVWMKKSPSFAAINAICNIHYTYQINNQALEHTLILVINNPSVLDALFTSEF